jgi:hypothetical protein
VGDLLGAIQRHQVEPLLGSGLGQGIAWFNEETTVADVMAKFVDEAGTAMENLGMIRERNLV